MSAASDRFACAVLLVVICAAPDSAAVKQSTRNAATAASTQQPHELRSDRNVRGEAQQDPPFRQAELYSELIKIKLQHPNIGVRLGLSPEHEQQLLDLMAQHSLESLDRSLQRLQVSGLPDSNVTDGESAEALITRQCAALKQLLGDAGFWRYHEYVRTRWQRARIEALNALLAQQPLTGEQIERMVPMLADFEEELDYLAYRNAQPTQPPDLRTSERAFAHRQALHQQLLQATAPLLNERQQAVFANWQTESFAEQRKALDSLHQRVGLAAQTAMQRDATSDDNVNLGSQPFSWRVRLNVNRATAPALTFSGVSGRTISFTTPEGLQVEATPLLAEDQTFSVRLQVFESDSTGRHFLGSVFAAGPWLPPSGPLPAPQTSVLSGSRGYALSLSVAPVGRAPSRERRPLPFALDQ